jgi:hypothetical protein
MRSVNIKDIDIVFDDSMGDVVEKNLNNLMCAFALVGHNVTVNINKTSNGKVMAILFGDNDDLLYFQLSFHYDLNSVVQDVYFYFNFDGTLDIEPIRLLKKNGMKDEDDLFTIRNEKNMECVFDVMKNYINKNTKI